MPVSSTRIEPRPGYQRKSITVFAPEFSPVYEAYTHAFQELGRFDYFPIRFGLDESLGDFLAQLRRYKVDHATEIAAVGQHPDLRFKDIVLSGSELDAVVKASYVLVPRFRLGPTALEKEHREVDKEGDEEAWVDATNDLSLESAVYELARGALINRSRFKVAISRRIELHISKGTSKHERRRLEEEFELRQAAALFSPPEIYFADQLPLAAASMMRDVTTSAKRLEPFILKAYLSRPLTDRLAELDLGREFGVEIDSTWNVYKKEKQGNSFSLERTGFLKVREVKAGASEAQMIGQWEKVSQGDELVEVPKLQSALSLHLGLGTLGGISPLLRLVGEQDLAPLFRSAKWSETYAWVSGGLLLGGTPGETVSVGVRRRFYLGQWILSGGLGLGVSGVQISAGSTPNGLVAANGERIPSGSGISLDGWSFGLGPVLGTEYQISPDVQIGIETGAVWGYPISSWSGSVQSGSITYQLTDAQTGRLTRQPAAIGISGPFLVITGSALL